MTDSFSFWKHGNMLGWIGRETGTQERIIAGLWPQNREIVEHPDTGRRIQGFKVPRWREIMDLCLSAAVPCPGLKVPELIGRKPFLDAMVRSLLSS